MDVQTPDQAPAPTTTANWNLRDLEHDVIKLAWVFFNGNITHAAKALGISHRTLVRKLDAMGIPRGQNAQSATATN